MSGEMVVGWRCHDVAANSHEQEKEVKVSKRVRESVHLLQDSSLLAASLVTSAITAWKNPSPK